MKLLRVQVQNYRSIVDSEIVDIDDRVTVIIGKNEQGKTNFLRGLASFNEKYNYVSSDLPHHLLSSFENQKKFKIPIVTIWLSLNFDERSELSSIVSDIKDFEEIKITKFFDGHYDYLTINHEGVKAPLEFATPNIDTQVSHLANIATGLKNKLNDHSTRQPSFTPNLRQSVLHIDNFLGANFKEQSQIENLIKSMITALLGIPGTDQPILDDINAAARELQVKLLEIQRIIQQDRQLLFKSQIPKFVFHSTSLDQIPNYVTLVDFLKDTENTSKGMFHLCQAAGLSSQKIQELSAIPDAADREPFG